MMGSMAALFLNFFGYSPRIHDPDTPLDRAVLDGRCLTGVIVVGERIAEVNQQTVAQVLRNMTVVSAHNRRADLVVASNEFAELLRVELACQDSRLGEVAKHDGELPTLGRCPRTDIAGGHRPGSLR